MAAFATIDEKVAAAVVAAVSAMVADGAYKQITDYYGLTPITGWKDYPGNIKYYYTP
jgi:hypothetical protein